MRFFRPYLAVLASGVTLLTAAPEPIPQPPANNIRGDSVGNWWTMEGPVIFRPQNTGSWQDYETVTGLVRDSSGVEHAKVTVPISEFLSGGWKWTADRPGFYSVSFTANRASGEAEAVTEGFVLKSFTLSEKDGTSVPTPELKFTREAHDFAVLPTANKRPDQVAPFFGISLHPRPDMPYDLVAKVGFHFVRIHPIAWNSIEPDPGIYDWKAMDKAVGELRIKRFEIVGNVFGTPKWASSAPEGLKGALQWKNRYTAYMPKDLATWTDFLGAMATRYPDIRTWELWNEPHLPGQSIFWMDSPENFVKLLAAGYEKLKQVDPGCTIWLGGIGMRYLPFYERIMELGAGKYFDVLALHGKNLSQEPFVAVDQKQGAALKPWVNSESHGFLMKAGDPNFPSERALGMRLIANMVSEINDGAEKFAIFSLINTNAEAEAMPTLKKQGASRQSLYGLFRGKPYIQPRFCAVVYRNFIDCFSGKIRSEGAYALGAEGLRGALLRSDAGPVLVFWKTIAAEGAQTADLAALMQSGSELSDWEGNRVDRKADGSFPLQPETVYFLKNPEVEPLAKFAKIAPQDFLETGPPKPAAAKNGEGKYATDPNAAGGPWISCETESSPDKKPMAQGSSARFSVAYSPAGLDLIVEVKGASGDGVRFALDSGTRGNWADRIEFRASLAKTGAELWKEAAPSLGGDLPSRYSYPGNPAKYATVQITPNQNGLRYQIHIERAELYGLVTEPGQPLRVSLRVDAKNGTAGYLTWPGGSANKGETYGTLLPETASKR